MTKNKNSDFGFLVFLSIALIIIIPLFIHRGDWQTAIRISKIILLSAFGIVIAGLVVFLALKNKEKIMTIIKKKEQKGKGVDKKQKESIEKKERLKNKKLNDTNISEENLLWLFDEEGRGDGDKGENKQESLEEEAWLPPEPFRFAKVEEKRATKTTTEEEIDRILEEIPFE